MNNLNPDHIGNNVMNILRVNMSRLETSLSPLPEKWIYLGGRGLSAAILNEEMPPAADPLGEDAKLILAGGPLAGAMVPSSGRISVGGKSPLTMGIKEANGGGPAAQKLDRLGIRAVVVEGAAKDQGLYVLKISAQGSTLKAVDAYKGMKTYELAGKLIDENGNKPAILAIGPAGERKLKSAAVILTDIDGHASRAAARGGLGAVMGAKGLKAVVIDDKGCGQVPMVDGDRFKAVLKDYVKLVKSEFPANMSRIGTPIIVTPLRAIGSMPALNFSDQELPGSDQLGGEHIETLVNERGGKMIGCMPGCLVRCSVVFNDAAKKHVTSSFEYETIGLMGTNLGVCDPDIVALLDRCCDELGVDIDVAPSEKKK
jgi:aldehyde:ferredoxin oxidoreductase